MDLTLQHVVRSIVSSNLQQVFSPSLAQAQSVTIIEPQPDGTLESFKPWPDNISEQAPCDTVEQWNLAAWSFV